MYKEKDRKEINDILKMKFFDTRKKTDPNLVEQFYEP